MCLSKQPAKAELVLNLLLTVLFLACSLAVLAQDSLSTRNPFYIEPEITLGKLTTAYTGFPDAGMKLTGTLSLGFANTHNTSWARYFNFPQTGVALSFSSLGNRQVLGYGIGLIPYVVFNPAKRMKQPFYFKLGLGVNYFTKHYNPYKNPENRSIGSAFTWAFQCYAYQTVVVGKLYKIKVGLGWDHASTGHMALPNFGYNSFSFGLSTQLFTGKNPPVSGLGRGKLMEQKWPALGFLSLRHGLGVHQLGGTGPTRNKALYPVYTVALSGGMLLHGFVKVRIGVAYRFYQSFYGLIMTQHYPEYEKNPMLNASSLSLLLGSEFMLGHAGLDMELGFNVLKPFFPQFHQDFEPKGRPFNTRVKSIFTQRIGLNVYLFNIKKSPKHNVSLGAHINANFGQAEFSDISLSYTLMMGGRKKKE